MQKFFATCPKGLEELLAQELATLGAGNIKLTRAGVNFEGLLVMAYRVCLWSRLASRVLLPLHNFEVLSAKDLYDQTRSLPWDQHLTAYGTLAVDFAGTNSAITHSNFGGLKVKDAIVDQLRERHAERPSIDTVRPDLRINVYLHHDIATLSLDLSGESLHRRGYRMDPVAAPLKENLASALLVRADWPNIAAHGGSFVDLMCGSGTITLEAALIAADIAPGLEREHFGFLRWLQHDRDSWQALVIEAQQRRAAGLERLPRIVGYDQDKTAVRSAHNNAKRLGLENHLQFIHRDLVDTRGEDSPAGLVMVNPPYGQRMGEQETLPELYRTLGQQFKQHFPNWRAAIFTGNPDMGRHVGLRPQRKHALYNGTIECKLFHYIVSEAHYAIDNPKPRAPKTFSASAEMFANRLRKDIKKYSAWAQRNNIYCYRLYDADMPEYNLAIDLYHSDRLYVHLQEYEAPKTIDPEKAHQRLAEAVAMTAEVLQVPTAQLFLKQRRQQKAGAQYEKLAQRAEFHQVAEGPGKFLVNFMDYLDTGLFLDHRLTRQLIFDRANAKHFLNLFAYTGSASVYAALAGAKSTTTVDMSNTYLEWAQRNMTLNGFQGRPHEFIQTDVTRWLGDNTFRRYDVIFIDPPTFSRSKRMQTTLDIQRDHVALLTDVIKMLAPDGIVIFSTNLRKFKLDAEGLPGVTIKDISAETLPEDFERNPKIHQCFILKRD
ncbi:MAG: bifunctional 23S rRNA (guanine(2069)-N(7))-methyltransferase RlmK/23S rRNA (guanine(2445)-N(2))-methyltransferase RlmL [Gammaproteobacteria bacterium]|nr:bifunctional 23S rRNA (guanine(2069)-N(7))-methyltransferase RlmK/23S rRNA (guanine(2445)-N(2))-methyltransferase RlmL [Gammaproteobacteria bacterium]